MNEPELKDQVEKARRAEHLLHDPIIKQFLKELRENVYHNIRTSHFKQIDEREDLYKMLQVMDRFEDSFRAYIKTGQLAQSKLDKLKTKVADFSKKLKHLP